MNKETQKKRAKLKTKAQPKYKTVTARSCRRIQTTLRSPIVRFSQISNFETRVFRHAETHRVTSERNLSDSRGAHGLQYCTRDRLNGTVRTVVTQFEEPASRLPSRGGYSPI